MLSQLSYTRCDHYILKDLRCLTLVKIKSAFATNNASGNHFLGISVPFVLVFGFQDVEEVIRLLMHREKMTRALHEIRIDDLLGGSLVVFCTFLALFAFRDLQRVSGEENFRDLFFRARTPAKSELPGRT